MKTAHKPDEAASVALEAPRSLTVEFVLEASMPEGTPCTCGSVQFRVASTLDVGTAGRQSVMIECLECGAYRLDK
jgi:hypothetical protein